MQSHDQNSTLSLILGDIQFKVMVYFDISLFGIENSLHTTGETRQISEVRLGTNVLQEG